MKRITALLHPHRLSDIVHELERAGQRRLSVVHARGLLDIASARELDYSVELGERMTNEIQLDVFCDDAAAEAVVALIREHGRTSQPHSGWIFLSSIDQSVEVTR
jgi:nitrogen regulatory protein P-II 1